MLASSTDFISAQDPFELGFLAYLLAKKYRKPFEVQDHGGFYDGEKNGEPLWFLRKYLALFLAKRAQAIRTVSPKSLKVLTSGFSTHAYFLPIAVEERRLR